MNKYKVKEGCRIEHNNQTIESGEVIELDSELALFHAANIETIKQEKKGIEAVAKKPEHKNIDAE